MGVRLAMVRGIVGVSLAALVAAGFPLSARAGMITTQAAIDTQGSPQRLADLNRVEITLARADVRARLQALGVNPADAAARAATLPDTDLARLAKGLTSSRPAVTGVCSNWWASCSWCCCCSTISTSSTSSRTTSVDRRRCAEPGRGSAAADPGRLQRKSIARGSRDAAAR